MIAQHTTTFAPTNKDWCRADRVKHDRGALSCRCGQKPPSIVYRVLSPALRHRPSFSRIPGITSSIYDLLLATKHIITHYGPAIEQSNVLQMYANLSSYHRYHRAGFSILRFSTLLPPLSAPSTARSNRSPCRAPSSAPFFPS